MKKQRVASGKPTAHDKDEPKRVGQAIHLMVYEHAVIITVKKEKLKDRGAEIWYQTVTVEKKKEKRKRRKK